jgi:hypothetical protein
MLKERMARLVSSGILVAAILLLPAAWGDGSVLGYSDNYTDNVSGAGTIQPPVPPPNQPQGQPPNPEPVPPPEPEPVPPDNSGGGCGGCGGGCGPCLPPQTAMSYTAPAPPAPPSPPPPLIPLTVNVKTLPINIQDLGTLDFGGGPAPGGR